jgi:hypothetical protein
MDRERKLLYTATVLGALLSALVVTQYVGTVGSPSLSEAVAEVRACHQQLLRLYAGCFMARRHPKHAVLNPKPDSRTSED